jgi:hypothetical protein
MWYLFPLLKLFSDFSYRAKYFMGHDRTTIIKDAISIELVVNRVVSSIHKVIGDVI